MKVLEALNHDWKEGEEVYVVCYSLSLLSKSDNFMAQKPYKVVKGKVVKINRDIYPTWRALHIELEVNDGLEKDISAYKNNLIGAMEQENRFGEKMYLHQEFCENKFFTEKEAQEYLHNENVNWNIYISKKANKNACHIKKMRKAIDELEKENIALQEQLILSK